MARYAYKIVSVFAHDLGRIARKLAVDSPKDFDILEARNFPPETPVHEDGSTVYDPMKPYVLFALICRTKKAVREWEAACRERDCRLG